VQRIPAKYQRERGSWKLPAYYAEEFGRNAKVISLNKNKKGAKVSAGRQRSAVSTQEERKSSKKVGKGKWHGGRAKYVSLSKEGGRSGRI